MSRLVCVPLAKQGSTPSGVRGPAGEDVYLAIDLSRSKWVYGVRWGGRSGGV